MVANTRRPPSPVIRALAVQIASHRSDLGTEARLYLAAHLAHLAASYGLPGTERIEPGPGLAMRLKQK